MINPVCDSCVHPDARFDRRVVCFLASNKKKCFKKKRERETQASLLVSSWLTPETWLVAVSSRLTA